MGLIENLKLRQYAIRGKTDVQLAWRHANKFPMHRLADTFDDFHQHRCRDRGVR